MKRILESDFTEDIISTRARSYCTAVLHLLRIELLAITFNDDDVGITMPQLHDVFHLLRKHLNSNIAES